MGNKNSTTIHQCQLLKTNKPHNHSFLSPDNRTYITFTDDNIFIYAQQNGTFTKTRKIKLPQIASNSKVLYNPEKQVLIYWLKGSPEIHQFFLQSNAEEESSKINLLRDEIMDQNSQKIDICDGFFSQKRDILLLLLNTSKLALFHYNNKSSRYEFIKIKGLNQCDTIYCAAFHQQRSKMILIKQFNENFYLDIYSMNDIENPNLVLSRLVYEGKEDKVLSAFKQNENQYQFQNNKHMERLMTYSNFKNGVTYTRSTYFGINTNDISLTFNVNGDKILYQSSNKYEMLHKKRFDGSGHANHQVSGWMNDFGGLHVIDINTGNSVYSVGASSNEEGIGWAMNDYLIVTRKKTHMASICSFNLEGFESETNVAECIFEFVGDDEDLKGFEWGICLLIAIFRGTNDRYYRQLTIAKYRNDTINVKLSYKLQNMCNMQRYNDGKLFIVTVNCVSEKNKYITYFYDAQPISDAIVDEQDELITFKNGNVLICRNLTAETDKFGEYFRM